MNLGDLVDFDREHSLTDVKPLNYELRVQNAISVLIREIEWLKNEVNDLRAAKHYHGEFYE